MKNECFNIWKFDTCAIIMGIWLLVMTFYFYEVGYKNFEGRQLFGLMLSSTYFLGSFTLMDGTYLLKQRYTKWRQFIREMN